MTGIEGLFETLTTEAQEAANQHVKYKELGSCLPDYHKAANGTNGTTNGIKQTNGNGTNQSWADLLKIFLPPLINLKWIMKYKQTFKQDFCFLPLKIGQDHCESLAASHQKLRWTSDGFWTQNETIAWHCSFLSMWPMQWWRGDFKSGKMGQFLPTPGLWT